MEALNQYTFPENAGGQLSWESIWFHTALAHEMLHLWQHENGMLSRNDYHNAEYAKKSEEIGLVPSSTGQPGGKRTGQKMSHYPAPAFLKVFHNFPFGKIEYLPLPIKEVAVYTGKNDKITYQYPECGFTSWSKQKSLPDCFRCFSLMLPKERKVGKQAINDEYEMEQEAAKRTLALLREKKNHMFKKILAEIKLKKGKANEENICYWVYYYFFLCIFCFRARATAQEHNKSRF